MSKYELIMDAETFGVNETNCVAIDFSILIFDRERFTTAPYSFAELLKDARRFKLSVTDQVQNYGLKVEADTVNFWKEQEPAVRDIVKPSPDDLTVTQFVDEVSAFLVNAPKFSHWWSRSNKFDPVIIHRLFRSVDRDEFFKKYFVYNMVRDTRTWIDAKLDFPANNGFCPLADEEFWEKAFKKHSSKMDIAADVLRMQTIARLEADLEQTKR